MGRADPAQVPSDPQVLPAYSTTCVPQAMLPWATGQSGLFLSQPGYTTALRSKSGKVTVPALVLHGSAEVQGKDKGLWDRRELHGSQHHTDSPEATSRAKQWHQRAQPRVEAVLGQLRGDLPVHRPFSCVYWSLAGCSGALG